MAYVAPNNMIGEYTVNVALSGTSATSLLSNAASSGRVFKVIAIVAANVDGTNAADISVSRYSAAALGGTAFPIASTISVPADASLIVADSTTPIMLAANTSLGATAGTSNAITMTVTYQEYAG
jgi:hypothetical protein